MKKYSMSPPMKKRMEKSGVDKNNFLKISCIHEQMAHIDKKSNISLVCA
jgi:hypothetical protein